ncbi:MAG: sugar kinase [Candidatus Omnitrophica bacterium]|nr:sugar kinase [Candidatus Omnitrophota bacterium]MCM8777321.1 sugar kinase [Candidatus Omnitrophota bacterium]
MENKVFCFGIIVGDFLGKPVESSPEKGKLVLIDRVELHIGGCAANTGIVLSRLGVNVAIGGKVGDDNLGRFVVNKLKEEKRIDTSRIKISKKKTTSGTIVLVHSDGERSFIHSIGANSDLHLEDIDFEYIQSFPLIHIAGALLMPGFDGKPLAETLKKAKMVGLITSLDTAWDATGRWFELIEEALPYTDYFLPSIEEAKMITGKNTPEDIAKFLMDKGVKNVCLKMGADGSFICNEKERYKFPALDFDVMDTTGCGDAYVAGFITGIVKGFSFEKCGMLANLVGAKAATSIGATAGIISYEDTLDFGKQFGYKF